MLTPRRPSVAKPQPNGKVNLITKDTKGSDKNNPELRVPRAFVVNSGDYKAYNTNLPALPLLKPL